MDAALRRRTEKSGLKRIFGVLVVVESTATNSPYHRTMTTHKGRKRRLFTAANVALQQLLIGQSCPILQKHGPSDVLNDLAHLTGRHDLSSLATTLALYL